MSAYLKIGRGYEINYDTKNWQEFDWFVEFEDVAPVDVYIRKIDL